ncbi:MAG TPA: biotin transporter BioY [Dermatophilaceae bacterium]|nr:biotin transporter BioY [Dermatophilaceae bacterium]
MTATNALPRPRVLADVVPGGLVRDAVLVAGGTGFIALSATVFIPLGFTPVPISLQTFSVLLTGAALGMRRGGLSALLYLLIGMSGVGWFAEGNSGWAFASFGYLVGMVLAAALVGWLAGRGGDRTVARTAGTMVLGNLVIYAVGVSWLMGFLDVGLAKALSLGLTPFLLGDALKIAVAAGLLPAAWALVRRVEKD